MFNLCQSSLPGAVQEVDSRNSSAPSSPISPSVANLATRMFSYENPTFPLPCEQELSLIAKLWSQEDYARLEQIKAIPGLWELCQLSPEFNAGPCMLRELDLPDLCYMVPECLSGPTLRLIQIRKQLYLRTTQVRELVTKGWLTINQALKITPQQHLNLESPQIYQLVKDQILSLPVALDLSLEQREVLANAKINFLLRHSIISIEEIFSSEIAHQHLTRDAFANLLEEKYRHGRAGILLARQQEQNRNPYAVGDHDLSSEPENILRLGSSPKI